VHQLKGVKIHLKPKQVIGFKVIAYCRILSTPGTPCHPRQRWTLAAAARQSWICPPLAEVDRGSARAGGG
jgi:hypothetical protein